MDFAQKLTKQTKERAVSLKAAKGMASFRSFAPVEAAIQPFNVP
jgi:hypothetical protein